MINNKLPSLLYTGNAKSEVPILAHEQGIQTITAEPWLEISDKGLQLEGLCFDRNG